MCSGHEKLAVGLYEDAAVVAKNNSFTRVYMAVLINLANQYEADEVLCDYQQAAQNRRKLSDLLSSLTTGRDLPKSCAICLEDLNVLEPSTDASRIVIPECVHAMHKHCFEQCQEARCPTCMSGVDMCPKARPSTDEANQPETVVETRIASAPAPAPAPRRLVLEGHSEFDME